MGGRISNPAPAKIHTTCSRCHAPRPSQLDSWHVVTEAGQDRLLCPACMAREPDDHGRLH